MHSKIFSLAALVASVAASPVPDLPLAGSPELGAIYARELGDLQAREVTRLLERDSTCINPLNIHENTDVTDCPHKNTINSAGQCVEGLAIIDDENCGSYCEMRNYWFPGPEQPFANSACEANQACSLAEARAVAVQNGFSINLGFTGVPSKVDSNAGTATFNGGASYSYSETLTYTTTVTFPRPTNATSDCGYFTFVPYYVASCGTASLSTQTETQEGIGERVGCNQTPYSTTGNWCNSTPFKADGKAAGEVVFVNTDCNGGGLLPMSQQVWPYTYPGVSTGKVPSNA